ncbi:MAG: hypothetical protein ABSG69_06765 [Candidatus Acidiferrum sp.]|jgi:hypothetical protein
MKTSHILCRGYLSPALLAVLAAVAACNNPTGDKPSSASGSAVAPVSTSPQLSADDISILFPAPTRAEHFTNLISVRELTTPDPKDPAKRDPIWSDDVFKQFLAIAASPAGQVDGTKSRIGLPAATQSIDAWYVAGIRIDAGAPGLYGNIRKQFGQLPEIRLIVQPVTRGRLGAPKVHDIAGHLIFNFIQEQLDAPAQSGCLPRPQPDLDTFRKVIADLATLRDKLRDGQLGVNRINTAGVPLGVHPGLTDPATAEKFRQEIISFLEKYVSARRLGSMAIAGLPAGKLEPWIFLAMTFVPPGAAPALPDGGFVPVHGPTLDGHQFAQLLEPANKNPRVRPPPQTNNLNPITCQNAALSPASLPAAKRNGVATAAIFDDNPATPPEKITSILDVVADPDKSHFFNTDCISCHTETRRAIELLKQKDFPDIDPAALPNSTWDVRNFGWSPNLLGPAHATVTRRTAAETTAVLTYINSHP